MLLVSILYLPLSHRPFRVGFSFFQVIVGWPVSSSFVIVGSVTMDSIIEIAELVAYRAEYSSIT